MNTLLGIDSDGGHICGISVWMSAYRADNLGLTSPYLIPELLPPPALRARVILSCPQQLLVTLSLALKYLD